MSGEIPRDPFMERTGGCCVTRTYQLHNLGTTRCMERAPMGMGPPGISYIDHAPSLSLFISAVVLFHPA